MTHQPNLRACDDNVDVQTLIRDALTATQMTYTMLAQVVGTCDPYNPKLLAQIEQARAANEKMLSSLRHPAGGK